MLDIPIIHECDDLLVINKPIGLGMHDQEGQTGVISLLKDKHQRSNLYLCHRLDSATSGCLMLAKNAVTASKVGKLFESKEIEKLYFAISDKSPKKKQGKITGDMRKSRNGSYMLTKDRNNPAITRFKSSSIGEGKRLFVCKPKTGKTHQIRVACKSISSAILGDKRYQGNDADRMYLHSYMLKMTLNNKEFCFSALPIEGEYFRPEYLNMAFDKLGKPEHLSW